MDSTPCSRSAPAVFYTVTSLNLMYPSFTNYHGYQFLRYLRLAIIPLMLIWLNACSSGSNSADEADELPEETITSFELLDPDPHADDFFGSNFIILENDNIVIGEISDSTIATDSGAVHLYNPRSQTRIASHYGDDEGDFLGFQIIGLPNGNFVIASLLNDIGGIVNAGSVQLIDGVTGQQIGSEITGDSESSILLVPQTLANSNYIVAADSEDIGGITDAGSVRLIDGSSGSQIGNRFTGDNDSDFLGRADIGSNIVIPGTTGSIVIPSGGIKILANDNFVIASARDDVAGIVNAGSVRLVSSITGLQIGPTLAGNNDADHLGSGNVVSLSNGNYVVVSPNDDVNGIEDAGSVRLFSGATGIQIGNTITSMTTGDQVGLNGVTELAGNRFVVASSREDVAGIVDAGRVSLFDADTGVQIGPGVAGDAMDDQLGSSQIIALPNGNHVVVSPMDDINAIPDSGSVRLIGTDGVPFSSIFSGDNFSDNIGSGRNMALPNGNFVIVSPRDQIALFSDAGSVQLVNGVTGLPIGTPYTGNKALDQIGSGGVTVHDNSNYLIQSSLDDVGGNIDAGSIALINGSTGEQIGTTLSVTEPGDTFGFARIIKLPDFRFAIASRNEDYQGVVDAGTLRIIDSGSGDIEELIAGNVSGDLSSVDLQYSPNGDFYVLGIGSYSRSGLDNSGMAQVVVP